MHPLLYYYLRRLAFFYEIEGKGKRENGRQECGKLARRIGTYLAGHDPAHPIGWRHTVTGPLWLSWEPN